MLHPTIRLPDFRLNTKVSFNHQRLTDKQQAVNVAQKRQVNSLTVGINGRGIRLKTAQAISLCLPCSAI
ncbi:Heme/hemopexin transporter protein huxB precursor [Mannheimia haemolytica]|uniref:Heme/hemopexin transporter protein huxB n=1 Tax=Mannheimia haemolytica TaxID=75985 RepID=A0A378MXE2_MANHA|nr:Heme/hemopexin transporter protein huxB precursor [Mannheimia haemolytica]